MRPISSVNTVETAAMPSMSPPAMGQPRSPWHSPVPYLFACSYWRLSGRLDNNSEGGDVERDVESGENEGDSTKQVKVYEEKILVIMAGEEKPTFLATPVIVCTKASSFGGNINGKVDDDKEGSKKDESGEKSGYACLPANYSELKSQVEYWPRPDKQEQNGKYMEMDL
ncbi:hypothetical protein GOBAR_DD20222 [Gossypium barbadense]|nr:hypothetical protein GOBAR_DD20222 [Gossypium barbadense]